MHTQRIQLSRKRGFNLQQHSMDLNGLPAVSVARPSRWGNPFIVGKDGTAEQCIAKFAKELCPHTHRQGTLQQLYLSEMNIQVIQHSLAGKNLACWCESNTPCHADWLLQMAKTKEQNDE